MTLTCVDYVGSGFTSASARSDCVTGTYSAAHCSDSQLVATCAVASGTSGAYVVYMYPPVTLAEAQLVCSQFGGVYRGFTSGPVAP